MSASETPPAVAVVDCGDDDEPRLARLVEAAPTARVYGGAPGPADVVRRAKGARVLVSLYSYTALDGYVIERLPGLELIATRTTGFTHIDVDAAARVGARVAIVPGATSPSIAEYVFGALFAAQRRLFEARESTRAGNWDYQAFRGFELMGSTLGVVGLGSIGTRVAEVGQGLGMSVLSWTRSGRAIDGVEAVALGELLCRSDVVAVCVALNEETYGLIGAAELDLMRPSAWIVNAARGGLVDEEALEERLRSGALGGAVLDVVDREPPTAERLAQLAGVPNLLVTPHIAWHTEASLARQFDETTENVLAFLRGEARNLVPLPQ